jgi:flagellar biosynthetic protein FliQ
MTGSLVAVLREGFLLALWLAAPLLVAALIAGVLSGLVAVVTQIQDPSVSLVPRIAAIGISIVLFGPSIARQLQAFAGTLWPMITAVGAG